MRELEATPGPDVLDLLNYWDTYPPVHILVRGFFESKTGKGHIPTEDELQAAIKDF